MPQGPVVIPPVIRTLAGTDALQPVWRNMLGGLTFRDADRFYKWQPRTPEFSLAGEAERLRWAAPWLTVPTGLDVGGDATHEWLVTAALAGDTAVAPRWLADPAVAIAALGRGLRHLHESLPVEFCPFDWSVEERIDNAARRGIRVPDDLRHPPAVDRVVVCHGDACSPNTLLDGGGSFSGYVDLVRLGWPIVGPTWLLPS